MAVLATAEACCSVEKSKTPPPFYYIYLKDEKQAPTSYISSHALKPTERKAALTRSRDMVEDGPNTDDVT